jgi:alkylation response protein AidB-like acyl-CoA dehydrogenase
VLFRSPELPSEVLREVEHLGWLTSLTDDAEGGCAIDEAAILGCLSYEVGRRSPALAVRLLAHHFCRACAGPSRIEGLQADSTEGARWFGLDATVGDDRFAPTLYLAEGHTGRGLRGSLRFVIGGDSACSWLGSVDLGDGRRGLVLVDRAMATSVAPLGTLGLRGLGATEGKFSEATASEVRLIAADGEATAAVDRAETLVGPGMLGITRALLENAREIAVENARTRWQNGGVLREIPAVRGHLEQIDRALGLVRVVAGAYQNQVTDARALWPAVRDAALRATDACLQVLGGAGYIVGNGAERLWRDTRQLGQLLLRDRW